MTSLKRHEALQPLSRDHVVGLYQAQLLQKAARFSSVQEQDPIVATFVSVWNEEILPHFQDEERILPSYIPSESLRAQLFNDHMAITSLVQKVITSEQPGCSDLAELGRLLDDHIRWEEHHLFPEIEGAFTAVSERNLRAQADEVERKRHRQSGKYSKKV